MLPLQREGVGEPTLPLSHLCRWWGSLPARVGAEKSHSPVFAPMSSSPLMVRRNNRKGSAIQQILWAGESPAPKHTTLCPPSQARTEPPLAKKLPKTKALPPLHQNHSNSSPRHWLHLLTLNQGPFAVSMTANGKKIPLRNLTPNTKYSTWRVFSLQKLGWWFFWHRQAGMF